MNRIRRILAGASAVLALALTLVVGGAAPAQALPLYTSGCLLDQYVCMYYDDYGHGANLGVWNNVPDFANPKKYFPKNCGLPGYTNPGCGGQGKPFWNDIASAYNCDDSHRVTIWYNANYSGPAVTMGNATTDGFFVSLQSTRSPLWNNNRSVSFAYAPGPANSNECFLGRH